MAVYCVEQDLVRWKVAFLGRTTKNFLVYFLIKIIVEKLLLLGPFEDLVLPKKILPKSMRLMNLEHKDNICQSSSPQTKYVERLISGLSW